MGKQIMLMELDYGVLGNKAVRYRTDIPCMEYEQQQ